MVQCREERIWREPAAGSLRPVLIFVLLAASALGSTEPVKLSDYSDKIRVACVGDSITYGSRIKNRSVDSYPAKLQVLLGDKYEVRNFGLPGGRVTKKSRKPYIESKEYSEAVAFEPHVVVVCLGINDVSIGEWERNKSQFFGDFKELISSFRNLKTSPKIWIGSLMPVMPPYEPYVKIQITKAQADVLIKKITIEEKLPLIDLFNRLNMEPHFYPDGLHPNKDGAGIIAKLVYQAITGDHGGLAMPWVFGDHMVLQRDMTIPVFGTADVRSAVTVKLGASERQVVADENGRWRVDMPKTIAGGPYTLMCSDGSRTLKFSDVLIGEVWYASGQSNMDWQMKQDSDWHTEGLLADKHPDIRLLNRQGNPSGGAGVWTQQQIENVTVDSYYSGKWQIGSQETAGPISAVAYYFGREIHHATGVPVGIIDNSKGGAPMEAFMPRDALNTQELYGLTKDWINASIAPDWHRSRARRNLGNWFNGPRDTPMPHHPFEPTFLYNADVADLIPFAIRGVIWYQGESNATDSTQKIAWDQDHNHRLFEGLISSWRQNWGQGDFPFLYVQLPNLNRQWMLFREMQLEMLNHLPNLGMAVTIDLGHPTNVHPRAKKEVARRLSLLARVKCYGQSDLLCSGPLFNGSFRDEGKSLRVRFDYAGTKLCSNDGGPIQGFELADAYGVWLPAEAAIEGNAIVLSSPRVNDPQAMRYAWAPYPQATLCNSEKLPASPFRAGDFNFRQKTGIE